MAGEAIGCFWLLRLFDFKVFAAMWALVTSAVFAFAVVDIIDVFGVWVNSAIALLLVPGIVFCADEAA